MTIEVWQVFLFALHLSVVADLPPEYGIHVWQAAEEQGVEPYDLAAVLVSEKSGRVADFSLVSALVDGHRWEWDNEAEGSQGERGLFQLKVNWAFVYGVEADELFDPWTNARIAAFVVSENQASHARKCESKRYNAHEWIAHYKCKSDFRDSPKGQCRFAQKKVEKIRVSLGSFLPIDEKAIGKAHNTRVKAVYKKRTKDYRRAERKRRRQREREQEQANLAGE